MAVKTIIGGEINAWHKALLQAAPFMEHKIVFVTLEFV